MWSTLALQLPLLFSLLPKGTAAPAAVPDGGVGVRTNDTPPVYAPLSDFDFESLNVALYQEWIELDLFNYGASRFTPEEFAEAGITQDDIDFIYFMGEQEVSHARLIGNMQKLGGRPAAEQCEYRYNFESPREFVNFCQRLTRWGESGVYGFLSHLDSRPAATLLLQSITTEARQQMAFRQLSGALAMPLHFETGISQSMSWSLLSRYIIGCPDSNPKVGWQIFPYLNVTNDLPLTSDDSQAAINTQRPSLTEAGRNVTFQWDSPGQNVSANNSYTTSVANESATPAFVAWISQLNVTYTPLEVTGENTGSTTQPDGVVFEGIDNNIVNDTMFVGLTDTDLYVTPYNLSLLNDHLLAFGLYQAN